LLRAVLGEQCEFTATTRDRHSLIHTLEYLVLYLFALTHTHTHTLSLSLPLPLPLSLCSSPLFSSPKGYEYANYTNGECGASFTRTTDNVTVCEGVWILSKDIP
jgi:hypothetical protein